jgi:hypothetical protein
MLTEWLRQLGYLGRDSTLHRLACWVSSWCAGPCKRRCEFLSIRARLLSLIGAPRPGDVKLRRMRSRRGADGLSTLLTTPPYPARSFSSEFGRVGNQRGDEIAP